MANKYGFIQCDRHGYVEATASGRCQLCIKFNANKKATQNQITRVKNTKMCRELDRSLRKLKHTIVRHHNLVTLKEGSGIGVFQIVTVNVDGEEDRQYGNKSYFLNIRKYRQLHNLHDDGVIYWNYADPKKCLQKAHSSPSIVVGEKDFILELFKKSLFKLIELTLSPEEIILFKGLKLIDYIKKFGNIFS